ncbi:MAG: NrsF family protein [Thermomicrobiales bacterium]
MKSKKSTDDLIDQLTHEPAPKSVWPAFPLIPLAITLVSGVLVDSLAGMFPWDWSSLTSASLMMMIAGLLFAALGLWLCLGLLSPLKRIDWRSFSLVGFSAVVMFAAASQLPKSGLVQMLSCYGLIILIAVPCLFSSIWLLQRGATLAPVVVGIGAGLFSGGLAGLLFLLHCPYLADGSGIHAEMAAISTLAVVGAASGWRLLKW